MIVVFLEMMALIKVILALFASGKFENSGNRTIEYRDHFHP